MLYTDKKEIAELLIKTINGSIEDMRTKVLLRKQYIKSKKIKQIEKEDSFKILNHISVKSLGTARRLH